MDTIPSIALGTWSWGAGMAGCDQVFGNHTDTKPRHVDEAAVAAKIKLTPEEISRFEALADAAGVDTKGSWENHMA